MIIIGIDPGTATTGYGIIKIEDKEHKCLDYGVINTSPKWSVGDRLYKIGVDLSDVLEKYNPDVLAIESLFFFKNVKTAIPVSQARGVILMIAAKKEIKTYEYTPLQAKMATVGYGRAEKKQIQEMVKILLNLDEVPKPNDAADALAIAICHISSQKFL
ncbi:MAG: crossover junction endodeoxyribonuclease RuvC [Candidatus Pacebacteria bacterium]|nr:crossover junction endodeoxyribonuclease RuvC [Candidatus Paceibacterota bacterium]